jgi:phosphoglycerate dehydrogenase-like enzyme
MAHEKQRVRVLEWVRDPSGVWELPSELAAQVATELPGVEVWSPATRDEADARLADADVVLGFAARAANFERARNLRWIHSTAAGVGGVLFPALVESDVVVTNSRGLHADSMAEQAIGLMLSFTRKLHVSRDAQRDRKWTQGEQWTEPPMFGSLVGATLGLVGLGRVGSSVASRARAMGMRVVAVRRHPAATPEPAHEQWPSSRLHDMLAIADWLVLVAPHTRETTKLIGAAELALLRPHARIVNLGRGALLDEAALVEAIRGGRLAGAALDVFEEEPLPATSPLWDLPGVILTPHTSGMGANYWERAMEQFRANLVRFRAGQPLENIVDKRAGY